MKIITKMAMLALTFIGDVFTTSKFKKTITFKK